MGNSSLHSILSLYLSSPSPSPARPLPFLLSLLLTASNIIVSVDTILFLRPCPVTVEVASETATLLIIPAYKMTELIDSDVAIAVHLFKRSAQILEAQIIKILQIEQQLQAPVSQNRKSQEILMQNSQGCIQKRQTQKLLRQSSHESLTAQSRKSQEFSAQLLRGSGGMPLPPAPIAQLSQN